MKKLRALVISDLHFEFRPLSAYTQIAGYDNSVDIVIIAGDINAGCHEEDFDAICNHFSKSIVYFIPGNHDYWTEDLDDLDIVYWGLEKQYTNLRIMNNRREELPFFAENIEEDKYYEGFNIVGSTLWFRQTPEIDHLGPHGLPDFSEIGHFENVYALNERSIDFLRKNVKPNSIVVTHFIPTYKSLAPMFKMSLLNDYFICKVDDIILDNMPKLWIHGHTHVCFDYQYGATRIIANPKGYPHEGYTTFDPNKIIEI